MPAFWTCSNRERSLPIDGGAADPRMNQWGWDSANGYTRETCNAVWTRITASTDFWRTLSPYATTHDDLKALDAVMRKGHEVYFVTARVGRDVKLQTEAWLRTLMPWGDGHPNPTVLITGAKSPIAIGLDADLIVDDRPDNLTDMPGHCRRYLFDRPWNQHDLTHIRVRSVREALMTVGIL